MIRTVIVDDETPARDIIKYYLKSFPKVETAGEANNGFDAMKLIRKLKPQLIFLDIQMPKLTGLELLELIDRPPEIIFSTAYDQYAIHAFEQNAIDYLLKPYSKERFDVAMQKALQRIISGAETPSGIQTLNATTMQADTLARIAVKVRHRIHIIPVNDICFIEADGDYVKLHTKDNAYLKEKTMRYFEENLPTHFIRIHRSYIVNVNEVAKIELYEKESYRVYLKTGVLLKASSTGYKALKAAISL
ncbi:MAG: LytTR family transcriptional regulator DNA-binding domain-containing protein [Bacteroidales bacterium]|nr:LytTR family transcriptional regulator DNA-binding domain-containing protein [Bacteroidales bacterium]